MRGRVGARGFVAILLVLAVIVAVGGCALGGGTETDTTTSLTQTRPEDSGAGTSDGAWTTSPTAVSAAQRFSTFKSKDPFIQQALLVTTTTSSTAVSTSSTSSSSTTTAGTGRTVTTRRITTTTRAISTTGTTAPPASTTTTRPPSTTTTTTAPSSHSLKIISVAAENDPPLVTFEVDGVRYDIECGQAVLTTWGQIRVENIAKVENIPMGEISILVTLRQGSEIVILPVGGSKSQ